MPHLAPDRLFLDFQAAVAGRYSLERELGRGGMGVVYLAREVRLDRPVAIKLLPPSKTADARLREYREFERCSTVAANAYIGPVVSEYVRGIDEHLKQSGFGGSFLLFAFTISAAIGGGAMIVALSTMFPMVDCVACG